MTKQTLITLAASSLCLTLLGGCDPGTGADADTPRGALLFDLSEAEVEQIHTNYADDEALETFRARLTAPFDCSLYGQFCEQVGPDAAYMITGEMVDLALEGAADDDIQAHVDLRTQEATALADEAEDRDEETFRASGSWVTQTSGAYRLRMRNGVTSPLWGDRRAWTEAKTQKGVLGIWSNKTASSLCVNAGTNVQSLFTYGSGQNLPNFQLLESINPSNACKSSVKTSTVSTYHDRNNNAPNGYYVIEANGCATAQVSGRNFSLCAPTYEKHYY